MFWLVGELVLIRLSCGVDYGVGVREHQMHAMIGPHLRQSRPT